MAQSQHQVNEIIRCGKDPVYFMNKYAKIQHPTRGLVKFNTYKFQDDCIRDFNEHRFNIILKSRQMGISTVVAVYGTWQALFYKGKNILIIATKLAVAQNFIKKVKVCLNSLPKWLMLPEIVSNNRQQVEFSNGSIIKAIPTSEDAGRSEALSLLIVDEAAFVRNFDELWKGLYPTLSTGGRSIILSTPNGVGGQYHKLYQDAESNSNEFNPIKLMWDAHPDRDDTWFQKETKNMSDRQIAQELLCDFSSSGMTFLSNELLGNLKMKIQKPIERSGPGMNVWYWKYPLEGKNYILSADVARGDGEDFSSFHVLDNSNYEVVCEFKGKIPPDKFAYLLYDMSKRFNGAVICPENNTYGYALLIKLRDIEAKNIYFSSEREKHDFFYGGGDNIGKAGFTTKSSNRSQILSKLEELIRNDILKIYSQRFVEEMKTFVWKGNRAQAMKGSNDDLIMSLAIACWICEASVSYNHNSSKIMESMLNAMSVNSTNVENTSLSPFYMNRSMSVNPFLPTLMNSSPQQSGSLAPHEDFSWIL